LYLKYPKNRDTVSGSLIEMANSLNRGSLCSSFSRSSLSIQMKLPQSMVDDVVHFGFVGGCVLKNQVVINQVKNPIFTGMFE
jgi:hypothetical protein